MPRFSLRTLGRPGECPEEKGAHLSSLRIRKDLRQQNFINMELIKFCIFDAKKESIEDHPIGACVMPLKGYKRIVGLCGKFCCRKYR